MNYAFEMRLGAMINTLKFINIGSGIQKVIGGGGGMHIHTQTGRSFHKPTFIFSK
jgi:hypothetical protein